MSHEQHLRRPTASLFMALALVVLTAAAALGQSWGEVRVVATPTNVRKVRDPHSPLVRTLQPGEKVRVDFVRAGWGAVFDLGEAQRDESKALGFADVRLLKPVAATAQAKETPAKAAPVPAKAAPAKAAPAKAAPAPAEEPSRSLGSAEPSQVRQVEARTEVHKERSLKSQVVAVLAPGERVQTGCLHDGFFAVFRLNDHAANESTAVGYVPQGMVGPASVQATPVQQTPKAVEPQAASAPRHEAKSAPAQGGKGEVRGEVKGEVQGAAKDSPALLGGQPGLNKQAPVRITSDKMVYNQAENSVVFLGNVHGTHTDMAIWSERITAYFSEKKKTKDQKPQDAKAQDKGPGDFGDTIERIVAEGNVRLVANKNDGACAKLTYMVAEGVIRMDGNPILREGQNTVRGDIIKFYVRENRSEVLSGEKRRVEAIFYTPKGEDKN